jgi:hypothetical protein
MISRASAHEMDYEPRHRRMSREETEREHLQALRISSALTRWYRKDKEPNVLEVTPEHVIETLHKAGINCVLMGTYAVNVYRDEARATDDVDVLVTKREVSKAVRVLEESFPYLEIIDSSAVARFLNPVTRKVVIDVMKPSSEAMKAVFRHTVAIGKTHRIPDLEMALVSKFLAMTAPNRKSGKKLVDAGDFTNMVVHNRNAIDLEKLRRLADRSQHGGGARILDFVEEIDAGRTIHV